MSKVLNTVSTIGALVMAATPLMAVGGFARAEDMSATAQHIRVADLDFSRPADRARFEQRVDVAARALCGRPDGLMMDPACRRAVRDEADQKLQAERAGTGSDQIAQAGDVLAAR